MAATQVPTRKLGRDGPRIPALGLGLMGLSSVYGTLPSDEERFALLDRAVELGATNWDSADLYGDSEELLGKWFKRTGKRDQIFLATKFAFLKGSPTWDVDSSAAYCKKACEESLRILGVDYIDLYYMHRAKSSVPIEETARALKELKEEGKIKYIGMSEISSSTLRRACKIVHIDAVQVEYSAFVLDIENEKGTNLLATARELGVAIVAYSPLGRGILTGNFASQESRSTEGDFRSDEKGIFPWFAKENIDANMKLIDQLTAMAKAKGATTAQLALAWLLKQGDDVIPIPGTKKIKYLEQNFGALKVEMTDEDEAKMRKLIKDTGVAGERAVDWALANTFADTVEES